MEELDNEITLEETEEIETEEVVDDNTYELSFPDEDDEAEEDLGIDPALKTALEATPELAGQVEEFIKRKEKGVQKLVRRYTEQIEKVQQDGEYILSKAEKLQDPARWREALAEMQAELEEQHGVAEGSRYGLQFDTDDRVVDVATREALKKLGVEPKELQEIVAERRLDKRAASAVAPLQSIYGELATPERVAEAVRAFPALDPKDAFAAKHIKTIVGKVATKGTTPKGSTILTSAGRKEKNDPGDFDWRLDPLPTLADYIN